MSYATTMYIAEVCNTMRIFSMLVYILIPSKYAVYELNGYNSIQEHRKELEKGGIR